VVVSYAAANMDPSIVSDHRTGNRAHLAWSAGPHTCAGQQQARLIASVAIEKILDRLPDMELAVPDEELVWRPGWVHRALQSLPVRFSPGSASALPAPLPAETDGGPALSSFFPPPPEKKTRRQGPLTRWWHGD
jgi:hypothetical protein